MASGSSRELKWQATATQHILEARKKHGRLGRSKSRGGCFTCKRRRIKCDEIKPRCSNCSGSGRICEGYAARDASHKTERPALVGTQLSQCLGLDEKERRTYDYFLSHSAPRITHSLDRDFWCTEILQVAQAEPVVLDALLAMSTLYEHPQFIQSLTPWRTDTNVYIPRPGTVYWTTQSAADRRREPPTFSNSDRERETINDANPVKLPHSVPPTDEYQKLALRHYNRAIRRIMEAITAGRKDPLILLLSCVLFICIEIMRDNTTAALKLFGQGASLMRLTKNRHLGHPLTVATCILYDKVKLLYARLSIFAAIFGHPTEEDMFPPPQESFSSLAEARTSLFAVITHSQNYARAAYAFKDDVENRPDNTSSPTPLRPRRHSDHVGPPPHLDIRVSKQYRPAMERSEWRLEAVELYRGYGTASKYDPFYPRVQMAQGHMDKSQVPCRLLTNRDQVLSGLREWLRAFNKLPVSEKNTDSAAAILMQWHSAYVWIDSRLETAQTAYDAYAHNYAEIIRLAEVYIKAKGGQPTFGLEMGAIAPLFMVATKCRFPVLRRKAIDLLYRSPKRECLWTSKSSAEVATVILAVEEEGLWSHSFSKLPSKDLPSHLVDAMLPPECSRVHTFELVENQATGRFDVRVTRISSKPDGVERRYISDHPI